uniref:Uncharacterized protein n=1 Tax=Anguilla anguilla TaxID=7936 RepID=A0A0E9QL35_ANGAN
MSSRFCVIKLWPKSLNPITFSNASTEQQCLILHHSTFAF